MEFYVFTDFFHLEKKVLINKQFISSIHWANENYIISVSGNEIAIAENEEEIMKILNDDNKNVVEGNNL